jgi:hypothetical protein
VPAGAQILAEQRPAARSGRLADHVGRNAGVDGIRKGSRLRELPDEAAIWFGILVLIVVGMGLTAPPLGLNVFVVHTIARDVPVTRTYAGVLPFLLADVVRLALVMSFPALALWLVRLLS